MCHDGIGAGQVNQKVSLSLTLTESAGVDHSFAGPVSGVLVQSGQCIEDGAFPNIGISGKRQSADENLSGVVISQGNHRTANQVGAGVAEDASLQTADAGPFNHAEVLQTAAHLTAEVQLGDLSALSDGQLGKAGNGFC